MRKVSVNQKVGNREIERKPSGLLTPNSHLSSFARFGVFEDIFTPSNTSMFSLMNI